jgi:alkylation response protein AidB-like acyl-CoA dehydrogenase
VAFALTAEQEELVQSLTRLLAAHGNGRDSFDGGPPVDRTLHQRLGEMGVLGLAADLPPDGATVVLDEVLVAECCGRAVAPVPVATVAAAGHVLAASNDPAARVAELQAGSRIVLAGVSATTGVDVPVRATRTDTGWELSGSVVDLLEAAGADTLLLRGSCDAGWGWFAVDVDARGVSLLDQPSLDQSQRLGALVLDAVSAELLIEPADDTALAAHVTDVVLVTLAAQATGAAGRALEISVDYAKTREQFGHPIGRFQAIKHLLVDMLLDVENARSASYNAAWAIDDGREDRRRAVYLAKAVATENAARVAGNAIQVHGGIGNTWEHECHLLLRRAKACFLALGSPTEYFEQIAADLLDDEPPVSVRAAS